MINFLNLLGILFSLTHINCIANERENNYREQVSQQERRDSELINLKRAKRLITLGRINESRIILERIHSNTTKLGPVKKFQMAIIDFIEEDYQKSYDALTELNQSFFNSQEKSCFFSIAISLGLQSKNVLSDQISQCRQYLLSIDPKSNFSWYNKVFQLKNQSRSQLLTTLENEASGINNINELRIWIKLNQVLENDQAVITQLSKTNQKTRNDPRIRELESISYYNLKSYLKSIETIENLETSNANNIRGLIAIENGDLKKATSLFISSLDINPYSQIALSKTIALQILQDNWSSVKEYSLRLSRKKNDDSQLFYLMNAIADLNNNQLENTNKSLNVIEDDPFIKFSPISLLTRANYHLEKLEQKELLNLLRILCSKNDGYSCWLLSSFLHHKKIKTSKTQKETILTKKYGPFTDESIFIDQKDIEEMDEVEESIFN